MVVIFQCLQCGAVLQLATAGKGRYSISLLREASFPDRDSADESPPSVVYPLIWSPKAMQRTALSADLYDVSPEFRLTDDPSGYKYVGFVATDKLVVCLHPPASGESLDNWGLAACRCAKCRRLLDRLAWPRPLLAGEPPLTGIVILDERVTGQTELLAGIERAASESRSAAAVMVCRRCKSTNLFLLRGKRQSGAAVNLDTEGRNAEH